MMQTLTIFLNIGSARTTLLVQKASHSTMSTGVEIAHAQGSEARLIMVGNVLAAIVIRILVGPQIDIEEGWFLKVGFGSCDREGLIFSTIEDSEIWAKNQINQQ